MASRGMYCMNPDCRWHTEKKGGSFTYSMERRGLICDECERFPSLPSDCKERWNFTTTHFNGRPIEVKGRAHLQQLEKQFGVSNHALNYDQRNWDSPPPVKPHSVDRELMSRLDGRNY